MSLHHGLRATSFGAGDPYFRNTVLLLRGDGTNGAQNNTFLDGSTNNFTVTRNGNTTQGSFTPYWPDGRWSVYFDGTGDCLTIADTTALQMSGDFTWEAWVYPLSNPSSGYKAFWAQRANSSSGVGGPLVVIDSSGNFLLFISNSAANSWSVNNHDTGLDVSLRQWQHIALVKNGTTITFYKDGVAGTTATHSTAVGTSGSLSIMSGAADATQAVDGWMSNFRILKGTAQYTAAFTPSAVPLTAITNTSLLTCQSNRFKDNSSNAFTLTRNGDAAVSAFNPFPPVEEYSASSYGGSCYLDGNGDYLTADASCGNFGSSDFTVECWAWFTSDTVGYQAVLTNMGSGDAQGWVMICESTNYLAALFSVTSGSWNIQVKSTTKPPVNCWSHIAVVRNGTTITYYLNGKNIASASAGTNSIMSVTNSFRVGQYQYFPGGARSRTGYYGDVRIVKNSAVYTADFTPPTAPLTAISGTSFLLSNTNGGIVDLTRNNNLETVGNAQISTSTKKYGTGSLAFDGTGDRLVIPHKPDLLLGSGDFIVEMWLYKNTSKTYMVACGNLLNANSSAWQILHDVTGNKIAWYSSFGFQLTSTTSLATSTWYHVAVVRGGTSFKLYLNGTQEASTTNSVNFNVANPLWVGHAPENTAGRDWDGYIDDLRITKGVARYTSNFTPPTRQLSAR